MVDLKEQLGKFPEVDDMHVSNIFFQHLFYGKLYAGNCNTLYKDTHVD